MNQQPASDSHPALANRGGRPHELVLRPARLDDAPSLSERCFPHYGPAEMAQVLAASIQQENTDRSLWLVAEQEDQIIGTGQLTSWRQACEIANLVVVPPYQRRGVGRALALALLAHAKQLGFSEIEIGVESDNGAALALYRQLGFREHHTLDLTVDGKSVTLLYLGRQL